MALRLILILWSILACLSLSAQTPEPDPNAFVMLDKEPVPVNLQDVTKRIPFPANAKAAGVQGGIYFRLLIDTTGKIRRHMVLKSPDTSFVKAVEKELYKLKFTPAMLNGKKTLAWITMPFRFTLLGVRNNRIYRSLEKAVSRSNDVYILDLSDQRLEALPFEVLLLQKIEQLLLNNNKLDSLPDRMYILDQIRNISLKNNRFKLLPPVLNNFPHLKELYLDGNKMDTLRWGTAETGDSLPRLDSLEALSLSGCDLISLGGQLKTFPNLKRLNLKGNLLTRVPEGIKGQSQLEDLNLSNNPITSIIDDIPGWPKLKKLRMTNTGLSKKEKKKIAKQYGELIFPKDEKGRPVF